MIYVDTKELLKAIENIQEPEGVCMEHTISMAANRETLILHSKNYTDWGLLHIRQEIPCTGVGLPETRISTYDLYHYLKEQTESTILLQHNGITLREPLQNNGATFEEQLSNNSGVTVGDSMCARNIPLEIASNTLYELGAWKTIVTIDAQLLIESIPCVTYAQDSHISINQNTSTNRIECAEDGLHIFATSPGRLACVTVQHPHKQNFTLELPNHLCNAFLQLAQGGEVTFKIIGDGLIQAVGENWSICAEFDPDSTPNWRNMIPDLKDYGLRIHRTSMLESLKSLKSEAEWYPKKLILKRHEDGLKLELGSKSILHEKADVSSMMTLQCDINTLIDVLTACRTDWLTLKMNLYSCTLAAICDGEALHVFMLHSPELEAGKELCPYCGKHFTPEACKDPALYWKATACSAACEKRREACKMDPADNRMTKHPLECQQLVV